MTKGTDVLAVKKCLNCFTVTGWGSKHCVKCGKLFVNVRYPDV